ncbi:MAG: radical SAM protein [Elusimicrobiota bacterium]|jgi:MoaA/NifB/PqqE/SkfB family radical SAM enzyme
MSREWWLQEDGLVLTWDLWYGCGYRCSYCWWEMEDKWKELASLHRLLSPEQWAKVWGRVRERSGQARIDVLGGEPLDYPRAGELLAALSAMHRLVVTTNLSPAKTELGLLLERLSPERVHFYASFHPESAKLEEFREKLDLLRERGFEPGVLFVAWPPFLPRLSEIRAAFAGNPFSLMVFNGKHDGREYPAAYTPEERAIIHEGLGPDAGSGGDRMGERATRGKLCHAGRVYANVKADGRVFRCGQDAFGHEPLGNIFEESFRLHETPQPCPYERCLCLEFRYLDECRPQNGALA